MCRRKEKKKEVITFLYPRCILSHPDAAALEEWISTKDYSDDKPQIGPRWHIPNVEEVQFANELLDLHFHSALEELLGICQTKIHSDPGSFCLVFSLIEQMKLLLLLLGATF